MADDQLLTMEQAYSAMLLFWHEIAERTESEDVWAALGVQADR